MPVQVERLAEPIPGYKLIERLGGGGFGEVWKAEAPGGLLKAIKFVYGDLQTSGDEGMRAEQELKAMSRVKTVRHPYILSLERFDIVEGRLIIVMELADRNLWDRFRECQVQGLPGIPRDELLRYMEETAEALDLMNSQYQLQHLDIKPQNIFLVQNHVKVADFGLVKDLQGMAASVTGGVTPVYASPETFDGWISRFCDQYSLSIVYMEMLTGQRPFSAGNIHQLIMQHVKGKPNLASLSTLDQAIIARALAKQPDERHACCMDMVRGLRSNTASCAKNGEVAEQPNGQRTQAPETTPRPTFTPRPPSRWDTPCVSTPLSPAKLDLDSHLSQQITTIRGDGVLVPSLVIGLGMAGMSALQQFKREMQQRFGTHAALTHVRLLGIDTDPETVKNITRESDAKRLATSEVLLARLKRAGHFLKPRDKGPRVDKWLNPALLYRITRNQGTAGMRSLGRLAFVDNYRGIVNRMRAEIKVCTAPESLAAARQHTELGLRSNLPRIYVISSLSGGTGSGMFLDLAYAARELLKQSGHANSEIIGVFLVPPAETAAAQKMALGNAYAALMELNHFSAPGATFFARYDEREAPLESAAPPFSRTILLPLPDAGEPTVAGVMPAAQFLYQDLFTSLGRAADACRVEHRKHQWQDDCLAFQAFGLFRLSWPRRPALQEAARRYCRHVVESWISKDGKSQKDKIRALVQDQEVTNELAADALILRFQAACERALKQPPEAAFAAFTDTVAIQPGRNDAPDPDQLQETVRKLEDLVGHPAESSVLHGPGILEETLREEGEILVGAAQDKLSRFIGSLIEKPGFRLAAAEEALRELVAYIEQILKHQEPLFKEFTEKATRSHERFQFLLANLGEINKGGRRSMTLAAELNELLRLHPKWRYQSLVLRRVTFSLTSLRGYLSDELRELSFYRLRLADLLRAFENSPADDGVDNPANAVPIFPGGCRTLDEALDKALPQVTTDRLEVLDETIQGLIEQQFTSLAHICTASTSLLRNLEEAMIAEMAAALKDHFAGLNVVDMYLNRHPQDQEALEGLAKAYDQATPGLANSGGSSAGQDEFAIVTVPAGSDNDRFGKLVRHAFPDADVIDVAVADEVVFYREETQAVLADLPQAGPVGQEAYRQLAATENFSLHSRMDIEEWRPLTPD